MPACWSGFSPTGVRARRWRPRPSRARVGPCSSLRRSPCRSRSPPRRSPTCFRSTCRPRTRALDAPPGERDNPVAATRAPADADGRERLAPAPDSGLAGGAPPDHAFRLDRSTLHARLSDGAAEAQPARLRISRRRASPQAIRREPTVGVGDSVRNVAPSRAPISPAIAGRSGAGWRSVRRALRSRRPRRLPTRPRSPCPSRRARSPRTASARSTRSPGRAASTSQQPGRAADDRTQRTASAELHPGLTDFSRATAPRKVAVAEGSGPSQSAGRGIPAHLRHGARRARRQGAADDRRRGRRANERSALPALLPGDSPAGQRRRRFSQGAGAAPRTGRDDRRVRGGRPTGVSSTGRASSRGPGSRSSTPRRCGRCGGPRRSRRSPAPGGPGRYGCRCA